MNFIVHHVCIGITDNSKLEFPLIPCFFIVMNVGLQRCNYSGYLKAFELCD